VELLETRLEGVKLIAPRVIGDERGFFAETYRRGVFGALGIEEEMVQAMQSRSRRGVVRGMHFQVGRGAAKLVRCSRGAIFDVVVDIRRGSPTFGEWEGFALTDENLWWVYVPVGFAHGFCVTCDEADVAYMQDRYYVPGLERGICVFDDEVGIEWPLGADELAPNERDATAPLLSEVAGGLPFDYDALVASRAPG
jgi:dTDP-4-dehydrorhamnose 3,5-epimerase